MGRLQIFLLFVAVSCMLSLANCRTEWEQGKESDERRETLRFQPQEPRVMRESEGGRLETFNNSMITCRGKFDVKRVTINKGSLLLPQYANSPRVIYGLQGSARMGLILPLGMRANVREVKRGEMVAVPTGMPFWIYNNANQPFSFISVADLTESRMHASYKYEAFHLTGRPDKEEGGILHGFTTDMLADAWNVDEETVRRLLKGQQGVDIVQVREEDMKQYSGVGSEEAKESNVVMMDFSYNFETADPDYMTEDGGCMTIVNAYKLPVLKSMRMSLGRLELQPNAMLAPSWSSNTEHMMFVTRGSARVQIVSPNGERAFDEEVKEGMAMLVPRNYPIMKRAGKEGFEALAFMNTDRPICMFMAGRYSVLGGMPKEVRMAAFNIKGGVERELSERRSEDEGAILRPREKGGMRRSEGRWLEKRVDEVKELMENMFM